MRTRKTRKRGRGSRPPSMRFMLQTNIKSVQKMLTSIITDNDFVTLKLKYGITDHMKPSKFTGIMYDAFQISLVD